MRQFTILGLMGLVLSTAVAFAALRGPNDVWASGLELLTLTLIGAAVLGVVHKRGKSRAKWLGFALFCGCYHLLASGPWIGEQARPKLPTTLLLDRVQQKIEPNEAFVINAQTSLGPANPNAWVQYSGIYTSTAVTQPNVNQNLQYVIGSAGPGLSGFWTTTAVRANREPFQRVGHALFAIVFGLVGMLISWAMFSRGKAERTDSSTAISKEEASNLNVAYR